MALDSDEQTNTDLSMKSIPLARIEKKANAGHTTKRLNSGNVRKNLITGELPHFDKPLKS